jgi:hypothetical protein
MASKEDDDLARLLREVEAATSGIPAKPAELPAVAGDRSPEARSGEAPGGRFARALRTGVIAGGVGAVVVFLFVFLLQWLPLIDNPLSSAMGAFVGGFIAGFYFGLRRCD